MVKSFKQALERRVKKADCLVLDRKTIETAARLVVDEVFGQAGRENIFIAVPEPGKIVFSSERSIWRSELALNRGKILNLIQEKLNCRYSKNTFHIRIISKN